MSSTTRSLSIKVNNATKNVLTITPDGGPFPPMQLAAYKSHTFEATGPDDIIGVLQIFDASGEMPFAISFEVSTSQGSNYCRCGDELGWLRTFQKNDIGAASVASEITLYQGVLASGTNGYVIELASIGQMAVQRGVAPSVYGDFTDAMFGEGVRNVGAAIAAEAPLVTSAWASTAPAGGLPEIFYADMTGGQLPTIVELLTDCWIAWDYDCGTPDQRLIAFFQQFLSYQGFDGCSSDAAPTLYVPRLNFKHYHPKNDPNSTLPVYELEGYDAVTLSDGKGGWVEDAVTLFMTLLVTGAHVAVLRYHKDGVHKRFGDAMDFRGLLVDRLGNRGDLGNSHYTSLLNMTGYYYLSNIDGESMPAQVDDGFETTWPGFLNAFMSASTNAGGVFSGDAYNTFFQLEGWPAHGATDKGGARHNSDYQASIDSFWNVSTFGASPYSEKRGSTVFLAPPGWTPVVTDITNMMPYYGAWANDDLTPQSWFQSDLVKIDSDTAASYDKHKTQ